MPALTLESTTVPVRPGGHRQTWEDLGSTERSGAGHMRSAVTATRGRAKVWRFETPSMLTAAGEAVETLLRALRRAEADGYLVGDVPIAVYVRNITRDEDPAATTLTLTFELHEAVPDNNIITIRTLVAGPASYVMNPTAATLLAPVRLTAESAAYQVTGTAATLTVTGVGDALLLETGDTLLLESGDRLLLE